ncbi:MAG TPA: AAA domain-containing protein [Tepidisphaeraceae bacterium]|nr:AAA domain-containing protein [Tepidisphaeraceae bacterium]
MIEPNNPILSKMLDRLFAAMLNGPSMNCRPHASRQRLDLVQLAKLRDLMPGDVLMQMLGKEGSVKLAARVSIAPRRGNGDEPEAPEVIEAQNAWADQQFVRTKLRVIADDARTYEQDTGVCALNLGFPLLSLPPGTFGGRFGIPPSRRVLAPIAFVPLTLTVKTGAGQAVEINRREGADIIVPNQALLAWLEKETGKPLNEIMTAERGDDAWSDVVALVRAIATLVELAIPDELNTEKAPTTFPLQPTPKTDDDVAGPSILSASVLGLYPASNQGLLRDVREMLAGGVNDGPIASFVRLGVSLDHRTAPAPVIPDHDGKVTPADESIKRSFGEEKMITDADPCQAKAVRLAREFRGLVIHGPPGTGKSQTITNIISDHLGRGQRVLFVCDKRTALDVVADRLQTLGLGELCAIIHDPQRDQRDLYRSIREQLDGLVDAQPKPRAADELAKIDNDLQTLHADLTEYHKLLVHTNGGPGSFHHLVGLWLQEAGAVGVQLDERELAESSAADLRTQGTRFKEVLERGQTADYSRNPWKDAAGIPLADFLATPMEQYRTALNNCVRYAGEADASRDPLSPAYAPGAFPAAEADARVKLAGLIRDVIAKVPAADRARWAGRAGNLVEAARARVAQVTDWSDVLRFEPPDNVLEAPSNASADSLARDREVLGRYLKAFNAIAADFARVRRSIGEEADDTAILHWLEAGQKAAGSAMKRLEAAQTIATAIEQTALDPGMVMKLDRTKVDATQINNWIAALDAYIELSGKMFGGLAFGKKAAAEAVVKQFGKPLSAQAAGEIKEFLLNLQARLDLQGVIESITGETFPRRAHDEELLQEFRRHFAVVSSLCKNPVAAKPQAAGASAENVYVPDEHVPLINNLVASAASPASKALSNFGLEISPKDAKRLETALRRLEARARLTEVFKQTLAEPGAPVPPTDDLLIAAVDTHAALLDLLIKARSAEVRPAVTDAILKALREPEAADGIIRALTDAPRHALALVKLEETLAGTFLFDLKWMQQLTADVRAGKPALPTIEALAGKLETLEGVLRVRDGLSMLPGPLATAAATLLDAGADAANGYSAVRRAVLSGEITRRLRSEPNLQNVDGHRLKNTFDRYLELSFRKKQLVREVIVSTWTARQKERLLISAGTRLNAIGADLRRRLTGRGDKAMRLRQVIAHGAGVEGGDPLFELRPIWMASPETVAQLFPRQGIFDLVVFDEASQCRLEEALPVLTRAKRVVIAGDPKQLPPTRFFESSIAASAEEEETESDQELFEAHQGEIEDLLGAALGLDIHQCYLDVHYRSRHADLIGFSNEQFYGSRLQAIPEHPRSRTRHAPLALVRADGVYEKRKNEAEADAVVKIVRDLLKRPQPPSIGIACFNLPQRDLIVEKLEEAAEHDADFSAKLAEARSRRGENSGEGLFVKNLENVQGDERDHLIVSTTYGPTRDGKFRRNFGPVGKPGGGRRLNVLVTRAREMLHVVTSIPRAEYSTLSPVPQGQTPSGTWLLFAYLNFCEKLAEDYETAWRILKNAKADDQASVNPRPAKAPSQFAKALAGRLTTLHNVGSDVHWGNEGFCVDLALHHPERAEDVSIGVLCDTTRYATDDPVEWEVFRTHMLQQQGWKVHRIWTPHFFRDPSGCMQAIVRDIESAMAQEKEAAQRAAESSTAAVTGTGSSVREIIERRGGTTKKKSAPHADKSDKNAA